MSLHPIKATQAIRKSYIDYLSTTFRLKDGELQRQLKESLETPGKFVKGPILEATPPFETGSSIEELILDGVLSSQFRELKSERMPLERPLYQHQEMAIRKMILHHRNLVVATGTGSGKTEAFLIPILNHLFEQKQSNRLSPGVRALLLYPMNALANDQMMRMHELLEHYPHIIFGRYTGETEEQNEAAESKYRKMFNRAPLENELISRGQMRSNPPHILLTNYAMLEYLLLRPDDHVFFDGEYAQDWRFIVIDEAHTYIGAKGIEMAMLLRRLKDRIVESKPGRLRCIATSATIGGGREDSPRIASFAQRLFGERFEWIGDDVKRQDVIEAVRKPVMTLGKEVWGEPHESLYSALLDVIDSDQTSGVTSRIRQIAIEKGVPEAVLTNVQSEIAQGDYRQLLFKILRGDERVTALQGLLEAKPQYLHDIAQQIFGDTSDAEENLAALVSISIHAKPGSDDQSLIPARYHLFVRAIEGAYLTLDPQKRLYLERRENIDGYKVFEIAVCRQCGSTYLVGETHRDNSSSKLFKQPGKQYFENSGNLEFLLLEDKEVSGTPIDEDEVVSSGDEADLAWGEDRYILCASCGTIDRHNLVGKMCGCEDSNQYFVRKVKSKGGNVYRCPACGKQSPSGLVWRFLTGDDATASVLAESLYQQLPPRNRDNSDAQLEYQIANEDEWSTTPLLPSSSEMGASIQMGKRQLLIFSDSRQSAAFFAPYLNRTHSQILQRRLIMETIEINNENVIENEWRVQDLVNALQQTISDSEVFPEKSRQEIMNEAWKWVFYELIALDRRNSLEGLGCLGFALAKPPNWQPPKPLMSHPWNLSADEVWIFFQILLDSIRTKGAMLFPDNISPDDDFFKPRTGEYYFRENQSSRAKHVYGWCPNPNQTNARLDFLIRLAQQKLGIGHLEEDCREVLTKIWRSVLFPTNQGSYWQNYFSSHNMKGEGTVYRMKYDFWELRPSTIDDNIQWYQCDRCNNLTLFNIRDVCPTYRCDGNLRECYAEDVLRDNHYRNLYLGVEPIEMRVEEHTAQLTSEAAADLQMQFVQGNVNVLSCSTTFELGVDVGELESVFMRNVPPSSANYVQRAGRAGRRIDSTAFALTFAQRRPHDLSFFNNPEQMVSGIIRAPHFEIENEKIIRRHVYATAIASFWKSHPRMFRDVDCFFFADGEGGPELFAKYLNSKPENLKQALYRIVPESFHSSLGIGDWEWMSGLFEEDEGVLSRCSDEVRSDVQELEKVRRRMMRENKPSDYFLRTINTIKERYLINFLSSRNVIPKYGFPVDVVELRIPHHSDDAKRLELDRDLRIALSEYAPSSQVVAGGKLWTSRYLKRLPNREWPKYWYAVCDHCQCYQSVLAESSQKPNLCKACGNPLTGKNQGTFVIPEFGFIVSTGEPQKPGEERPERTYTTRTYYSGKAKEGETVHMPLDGVTLLAIPASDGQMAVINHAGFQEFRICPRCGYAILGNESVSEKHETPWRGECRGRFSRLSLGHEFKTDILQLRFGGHHRGDSGFWLSLLYALLEGASESLDIDRQDLDGCLYSFAGDPAMPALILFDDVPGGAGHVRRIGESKEALRDILVVALQRLKKCDCGGEEGNASCYGCLRNYRNQFCHDQLNRGIVCFRQDKKYIVRRSKVQAFANII